MESMAHVLVLANQGLDEERFAQLRPLVDSSIRAVYEHSGRLDIVVLIGGNTAGENHGVTGDRVIDYVQEGCINSGALDLPIIVPVPGMNDIHRVPAQHMLVDAVTRRWREVEAQLWAGEQDDVIEALALKVFSEYLAWQRSLLADVSPWHSGVLPGEGSLDWTHDGQRIGLVSVNTVFRTLISDAPADRATLAVEQLDGAVPGSWQNWTAANTLTVVAAGLAAKRPLPLDVSCPTLFVSGRNLVVQSPLKRAGWLVVEPGHPVCLQIRLTGPDVPDVRDITRSGRKNKIALQPSSGGSPSTIATQKGPVQLAGDVLSEFYQQVSSGRMLAVLVSGLPDGETIDIDTLRTRLTADVFGEAPEPPPHMDEVWAVALARLETQYMTQRLEDLRGEPGHSYPSLRRMLTAPWWRVYDFSASSALRTVVETGDSKALFLTDALSRKPGGRGIACEIAAMNGTFNGTVESVDFSTPAMDGTSARALWFNRLKSELVYYPVVFFAASASSDALWQILAAVNSPLGGDRFLRFLVTPDASPPELSRIEHNKLKHISARPTSFAAQQLMPGNQHLEKGKRRLMELISTSRLDMGISLVSAMVDKRPKGSKKFLEGHEPGWGDVVDGFAAKLSVTDEVLNEAEKLSKSSRRIVLLRGRAGSGKTTVLMQCAYKFHQQGQVVGWLDRSATKSLSVIRAEAAGLDLDAVFVDDVDIFGNQTDTLLRELSAGGRTLVVAAVRNTKLDFIPNLPAAVGVSADRSLTDDDLQLLINLLKKNGLLGVLKQFKWPPTRLRELRRICDRSLLVAMIQVVTGKLFDEKVRGDFESLNDEQAFAYTTICVLESAEVFKGRGVNPVDLLQIVSQGPPSSRMEEAIAGLMKMRMVIGAANGTLRCWHRTIADTMIKVMAAENLTLLGGVMKALLRFYAGYAGDITDSNNPYRRTMIRLLNHALMIDFRLPDDVVREIYDSVHEFLEDDFHYWLQMGEFESQRNHLERAANYFQSARGCGGVGDYKVDTGWASVTLRLSATQPDDTEKRNAALGALRTLDQVCLTRGSASEHSFVVMIRAGTEWLEKMHTILAESEFATSWATVKGAITLGKKIKLESVQFDKAVREYEPRLTRLIERGRGVPT
jgi:hypothetical protein